ncbi:MAG: hypothetical protein R3300_12220 [Candidatus Promineifilaceae bacterium]|nr:hypothetical protein [Candidatus Promineifilaceae bacterium]
MSFTVWRQVLLLLSLLVLTSGCAVLRRSQLGTEIELSGPARLVCSNDCADRGQCGRGTSANAPQDSEVRDMVLLNRASPQVTGHDVAVAAETPVNVIGTQLQTVELWSTGERLDVPYYLVDVSERGQAWVAGWCVGN